jgi:hypothetical protein
MLIASGDSKLENPIFKELIEQNSKMSAKLDVEKKRLKSFHD